MDETARENILSSIRNKPYDNLSQMEKALLVTPDFARYELDQVQTSIKGHLSVAALFAVLLFFFGYGLADFKSDFLFFIVIYSYASSYFREREMRLRAEWLEKEREYEELLTKYIKQHRPRQ